MLLVSLVLSSAMCYLILCNSNKAAAEYNFFFFTLLQYPRTEHTLQQLPKLKNIR